ncbi:hypothetical protein ACQKWADRAFT_8892 [Trichoderma austrokoningii]
MSSRVLIVCVMPLMASYLVVIRIELVVIVIPQLALVAGSDARHAAVTVMPQRHEPTAVGGRRRGAYAGAEAWERNTGTSQDRRAHSFYTPAIDELENRGQQCDENKRFCIHVASKHQDQHTLGLGA